MLITFFAAILGIIIGVTVAVLKVYCYQSGKLKPVDVLLNIYLTVIRGTPTLVQLLIMYFIIAKSLNGTVIAIIAFGINSGAYAAEIVRAGILAVDKGQTEAGRSLGLSAWTTMEYFLLPEGER